MVEAVFFLGSALSLMIGIQIGRALAFHRVREAELKVAMAEDRVLQEQKRADLAIDEVAQRLAGIHPVSQAHREEIVAPAREAREAHDRLVGEFFQSSDDYGDEDPMVEEAEWEPIKKS